MSLYHTPLVEDEREPKRIEVKKMPLIKSKSDKALGKNIAAEEAAGKPRKQAIAIGLSVKRKAGGKVAPKPKKKEMSHVSAKKIDDYGKKSKKK